MEIIKEMKTNIDPKKSPGFDLITEEILRQLSKKAIVKRTYLYNMYLAIGKQQK
jgi:hypothetical protein